MKNGGSLTDQILTENVILDHLKNWKNMWKLAVQVLDFHSIFAFNQVKKENNDEGKKLFLKYARAMTKGINGSRNIQLKN